MDEEYIKLLQQQAAAGSEMAIFELQQLGYDARIPDADVSNLTFEAVFPYAKTLRLGMAPIRAFNAARFTGTPGAMYRGIGAEGLKDLQKSGVLRPKQNIPSIKVGSFDLAKDFNKVQKGIYASPYVETAKRYGQGVIAEIPEGAAKFMQRYKGTNWSQKTQDLLPVDNINVFKQNFFGTYKPVKFNYGGSMKKIKKYPHGGPHSTMLPEVTVTPQMEELHDRQKLGMYSLGELRYEPSFFGQGKYFDAMGNEVEGMGATTGIAPDPSGMSIKQLVKLAQNLPKFLKFVKNQGPDAINSISKTVTDAYKNAKRTVDLGLAGYGKEKEAIKNLEQIKDVGDKFNESVRMIREGQKSLIPPSAEALKGLENMSKKSGPLADLYADPGSFATKLKEVRDLKNKISTFKKQMDSAKKLSDSIEPKFSPEWKKAREKYIESMADLNFYEYKLPGANKIIDDIYTGKSKLADQSRSYFESDADMILKGTLGKNKDFNFTPGEGMILDSYLNPFKLNKYGGMTEQEEFKGGGLWANIHAKRARGERMRKKGEKGAPTEAQMARARAEYGGKSMDVDYEAEGGEVVIGDISVNRKYNGGTAKQYKGANMFMLGGPRHEKGGIGIKVNSDEPSYVFTDRLKVGGMKGATYADMAAKFGNELDNVTTMAMGGDKYDRTTAKLMKPRLMEDVEDLFNDQEEYKRENNIDQEPKKAAFGEAFASMASSAGMSHELAALQFLPGLFNIGKGLLGKAPELEYDPIIPETQEYQDFSPLMRSYLGQQNRSLATLRAGLEGSGASGSQLRAGFQAGLSGSQANAANFLSQVGQMQAQSNRQTDQFNISQQTAAQQGNMQAQMMADQFAAQYDPAPAFSQGLSQILGTATGMSREGYQRGIMNQLFGLGNNTTSTMGVDNSAENMLALLQQYTTGNMGVGLND